MGHPSKFKIWTLLRPFFAYFGRLCYLCECQESFARFARCTSINNKKSPICLWSKPFLLINLNLIPFL